MAFALYAFGISMLDPRQCIVFYFLSFVCDELDGRFARKLQQTSTLGAVLDMVTDRWVLRIWRLLQLLGMHAQGFRLQEACGPPPPPPPCTVQ